MFLSPPLSSEGPALCLTVFLSATGKQKGQRSIEAACTCNDDRLLFIEYSASGRRFLVDSGAQRSIMPPSSTDALGHGQGPPLNAANGPPIRTFGTRFMTVCFKGREFSWDIVVASVSLPILGTHILCAYRLLVDVSNRRVIDVISFDSYPCTLGNAGPLLANMLPTGDMY